MTTETNHAKLEIIDPRGESSIFTLDRHRYTLGRSGADIMLPDKKASRIHAEIYCDPFGRWWIHDLQSRNGTWINGQRVNEQSIQAQDTLMIGSCVIRCVIQGKTGSGEIYHSVEDPWQVDIDGSNLSGVKAVNDLQTTHLTVQEIRGISEFSQSLLNTDNPKQRLHQLGAMVLGEPFRARGVVILLVDPNQVDNQLRPIYEAGKSDNERRVSRTLIKACLDRNQTVMGSNIVPSQVVHPEQGINLSVDSNEFPMTAVACPLDLDGNSRRVMYMIMHAGPASGEWLAILELAAIQFRQADAAAEARERAVAHAVIERDLQEAQGLQRRLVPQVTNFTGLEIGLIFKPCRWVAGDYLDMIELDADRYFVAIADVCGKGMQAALVTTSIHAILHNMVDVNCDLDEIATRLNKYLCEALQDRSFVTMVMMILNTVTGDLHVVNAGHPAPLLYSDQSEILTLPDANNPPMGILPEPLKSFKTTLPDEHVLTMYTDGITEMPLAGGDLLELRGIAEIIAGACKDADDQNLEAIAAMIDRRLDQLSPTGPSEDDRTMILIRRRFDPDRTVDDMNR